MKPQLGAVGVAERTAVLTSRKIPAVHEPVWYRVLTANPPDFDLISRPKTTPVSSGSHSNMHKKDPKTGAYITRNKERFTGHNHLYRIKSIQYPEDKIRKLFYSQHPWELARPRNLIEKDGNDSAKYNWKTIDQPNKRLDGESVVQRTLYLKDTPEFADKNILDAYDKARWEFYRLRIREEAEIQVASEESAFYGTEFTKSYIQRGIESEQKVIERWVEAALEATKEKEARMQRPVEDIEDKPDSIIEGSEDQGI